MWSVVNYIKISTSPLQALDFALNLFIKNKRRIICSKIKGVIDSCTTYNHFNNSITWVDHLSLSHKEYCKVALCQLKKIEELREQYRYESRLKEIKYV